MIYRNKKVFLKFKFQLIFQNAIYIFSIVLKNCYLTVRYSANYHDEQLLICFDTTVFVGICKKVEKSLLGYCNSSKLIFMIAVWNATIVQPWFVSYK